MPQINHHRELTRPCYDSGPVEIHGKPSEELISSQKTPLGNSSPACSLLVRSAGFCWLAGPKVCTIHSQVCRRILDFVFISKKKKKRENHVSPNKFPNIKYILKKCKQFVRE